MAKQFLYFLVTLIICTTGCTDKKAQHEATEIKAAMIKHCARIHQLSLEEYTQEYMLHNGNTEQDRNEAKKDYLQCIN